MKLGIQNIIDNDLKRWPNEEYIFVIPGKDDDYTCSMKRNMLGAWCGYITLPEKHPFYKYNKEDLRYLIKVHGHITYGKYGTFGFDCAHKKDYAPKRSNNRSNSLYWTIDMTFKEVCNMVSQFDDYQA